MTFVLSDATHIAWKRMLYSAHWCYCWVQNRIMIAVTKTLSQRSWTLPRNRCFACLSATRVQVNVNLFSLMRSLTFHFFRFRWSKRRKILCVYLSTSDVYQTLVNAWLLRCIKSSANALKKKLSLQNENSLNLMHLSILRVVALLWQMHYYALLCILNMTPNHYNTDHLKHLNSILHEYSSRWD